MIVLGVTLGQQEWCAWDQLVRTQRGPAMRCVVTTRLSLKCKRQRGKNYRWFFCFLWAGMGWEVVFVGWMSQIYRVTATEEHRVCLCPAAPELLRCLLAPSCRAGGCWGERAARGAGVCWGTPGSFLGARTFRGACGTRALTTYRGCQAPRLLWKAHPEKKRGEGKEKGKVCALKPGKTPGSLTRLFPQTNNKT